MSKLVLGGFNFVFRMSDVLDVRLRFEMILEKIDTLTKPVLLG